MLAGPWCTQILADLGADVIKIERPGVGDDTRTWGPPFLKDTKGDDTAQSTYFTACNRNKRSVTVDMTTPEGRDVLLRLAARSDIVVENFKTGGLAQYGLDHASLRARNRRLIYCSITGFGHDGPYAERARLRPDDPGHDRHDEYHRSARRCARGGTVAGRRGAHRHLHRRPMPARRSWRRSTCATRPASGQHIDMALLDVGMAILANQASAFLNTGVAPQRQGNSHPSLAPYQDFETSDGAMLLAIGNNGQFRRFCEAAGHCAMGPTTRALRATPRACTIASCWWSRCWP